MGTDGFLRYMHQEMTYVLRGGHNPSVWMACFDFPDHRNIPPITTAALKAGDYFDRVMEAVERSGGRCRHTVLTCGTHSTASPTASYPSRPEPSIYVWSNGPIIPTPLKGMAPTCRAPIMYCLNTGLTSPRRLPYRPPHGRDAPTTGSSATSSPMGVNSRPWLPVPTTATTSCSYASWQHAGICIPRKSPPCVTPASAVSAASTSFPSRSSMRPSKRPPEYKALGTRFGIYRPRARADRSPPAGAEPRSGGLSRAAAPRTKIVVPTKDIGGL